MLGIVSIVGRYRMKILILGYGKTGKDLEKVLRKDNEVYIYDDIILDKENYLSYKKIRKELPYYDYIIRSPGISSKTKIYKLCTQLSQNLVSEVEFFSSYYKNKIVIGVTGTNGKTTLVTMLYHILSSKYRVCLLGNIGNTISSSIKTIIESEILIFELSSFMLEDTKSLNLDYGIITNLSRNHLDKVHFLDFYYASKLKIRAWSNKLYIDKRLKKYFVNDSHLIIEKINAPIVFNENEYNENHFKVAYDIATNLGIDEDSILKSISSYKIPSYRNELKIKDNFFIVNDSKSTSVEATNACLSIYKDKKRVLILGGIAKSGSFKKLKIRKDDIILSYGRDRFKIVKEVGGIYFDNLDDIKKFIRRIKEEVYILFSPGCSSLDQYSSYVERGKYFDKIIQQN